MASNWLLLRGLGREKRHWEKFPGQLVATTGGSVFTLDLPGSGTEYQRLSPWSIRGIVEDLRARWLALPQEKQEWNVLAVSMGGMIAQEWVRLYPQDFKRIVLINSSARNVAPFYHRLRIQVLPKLLWIVLRRHPLNNEKAVLGFTTKISPDSSVGLAIAERWAGFAREFPMATHNFMRQLFAAAFFKAPKNLPVPILVLTSKGDDFTSPHCSIRLARFHQAPLWVHPSGGHDLTMDDGKWVAERVQDFCLASRAAVS